MSLHDQFSSGVDGTTGLEDVRVAGRLSLFDKSNDETRRDLGRVESSLTRTWILVKEVMNGKGEGRFWDGEGGHL